MRLQTKRIPLASPSPTVAVTNGKSIQCFVCGGDYTLMKTNLNKIFHVCQWIRVHTGPLKKNWNFRTIWSMKVAEWTLKKLFTWWKLTTCEPKHATKLEFSSSLTLQITATMIIMTLTIKSSVSADIQRQDIRIRSERCILSFSPIRLLPAVCIQRCENKPAVCLAVASVVYSPGNVVSNEELIWHWYDHALKHLEQRHRAEPVSEQVCAGLQGDPPRPGGGLSAGGLAVTSGRKQWRLIGADRPCEHAFPVALSVCCEHTSSALGVELIHTLQIPLCARRGRAGVGVSYSAIQQTLVCQRRGGRCGAGQFNTSGEAGGGRVGTTYKVSVNNATRVKLTQVRWLWNRGYI